ncbi:hypothetical protein [Streptomyces afghaniensis]|nr:hypothetical protein [Streptomyces afghaniensis]
MTGRHLALLPYARFHHDDRDDSPAVPSRTQLDGVTGDHQQGESRL